MAYNNYFPMGYQPYMYQQPVLPQYQTQNVQPDTNTQANAINAHNGIIWVQGEAGAKAYPVAPNSTVQLWDSESQVVYLKSADGSGMPSMKILDYTIRDTSVGNNGLTKQIDLSGYVTREEFDKALAELRKGNDESDLSAIWKAE